MEKKSLYAVFVVIILVIASVSVYVAMDNDEEDETVKSYDNAELKVFGNVNGDRFIDDKDVKILEDCVKNGYSAEDYPLADANQDGVIDDADVEVIRNVAAGKSATIYHISYHDVDGNGTMDTEIVSTKYPVKSAIMTGSNNTSMFLYCLGIVDQIKGASGLSSLSDKNLFKDSYLNADKCVNLGKSSTSISFEDGKVGSSEVIKNENVTALITDWNRTYVTNESDFENAGVDVVRVASVSVDRNSLTHSAMLMGLLFQCSDRANEYVDMSLKIIDYVQNAVKDLPRSNAVASSMTDRVSVGTSDFSLILEAAGGVCPLPVEAFGGSVSPKVSEHPEIFSDYSFDYVIHVRSNLNYDQTQDGINNIWKTYTKAFSNWEHSDTGQYLVSGSIPAALRVAYVAEILHGDSIDSEKITEWHQEFVDQFFNGKSYDVSSLKFMISSKDITN